MAKIKNVTKINLSGLGLTETGKGKVAVGLGAGTGTTLAVASGGTGVTSKTGTGSVVLSNTPTLVTPVLGTPGSGNFSSGSFTWPTFNQSTSGTAALATTVTITDNESTDEDNAVIFTAGGDIDGGNLGLESDGHLIYNPSTGRLTATQLAGTLQTASQTNITSVGTIGTGVWQGTDIGVQHGGTGVGTHTSNGVLTGNGTSAIESGSNLTWNETELILKNSSDATNPKLIIENSGTGGAGGALRFYKNDTGADTDVIGTITFDGKDSGDAAQVYGSIIASIVDASGGAEGGQIQFNVASIDGEVEQGLLLEEGSNNEDVDVTIANNTTSITTIAGKLSITSDATLLADQELTNSTEGKPVLTIKNTHQDGTNTVIGGEIKFQNTRGGNAGIDDDTLGRITFYGPDSPGATITQFAEILAQSAETGNSAEGGSITFKVASHNGTLTNGLVIEDGNDSGELDVTIAAGASSVTTTSGNLTTTGDITVGGGDISGPAGGSLTIKAETDLIFQVDSDTGGTETFQFKNGSGTEIAELNESGDLQIDGDLTITGYIETNDGELLIKAGDGDHASILLHADDSDDNGDDWSIQSNTDNRLYIYNNKSGSAVAHLSITPNATVANSTLSAKGKITAAGNISSSGGEIVSGWHGNSTRVKFYPNQFVESEDTNGRYYAVVDDDNVPFGIRVTHTSAIMYAFIPIPTGYKATHIRCYGGANASYIAVDTFEHDIDDGLRSASLGSGDADGEINITDVASTDTNSIIIKLTFTDNATSFYGGYMTIYPT